MLGLIKDCFILLKKPTAVEANAALARINLQHFKANYPNHAKVIMLVDKKVFFIGSQDFYSTWPSARSELSILVEDNNSAVTLFLQSYFKKALLWTQPKLVTTAFTYVDVIHTLTIVETVHLFRCKHSTHNYLAKFVF